jgi:hypothetical protein
MRLLKSLWFSVSAFGSIIVVGWFLFQVGVATNDSRANAWALLQWMIPLTSAVGLGAMCWGLQWAEWSGPRIKAIPPRLLMSAGVPAAPFIYAALIFMERGQLGMASLLAAAPFVGLTWICLIAYDGATKPDIRRQKLIPVSFPAMNQSLIVLIVFPILVRVFEFLFSFPILIVLTPFAGRPGMGQIPIIVHLIALCVALASAFRICRGMWSAEKS